METIILSENQRKALLEEIENWRNEKEIYFEREVGDDLVIIVKGWVFCDGYMEENTGSYIETYRDCSIDLRGIKSKNEGDSCEEVYIGGRIQEDCLRILERLVA